MGTHPFSAFVDQARIWVKAGHGGRGCNSRYRDKYVRLGVPDGGDGGNGSDIIIEVSRNLRTLLDYRYRREFRGKNGAHGSGKGKRGRDGEPLTILVPPGTICSDAQTGALLRDLTDNGETLVVAKGGRGGMGNRHRRDATEGEPGQERFIQLDLKLLADVGVVGFPNAGKSTLISHISNAHPDIAAYPFTTKTPVLGVVRTDAGSFVIADIPGLIKGASQGKGLGDRFLRHIERTRLLVHLIDLSGSEGRDPFSDYHTINAELKGYSPALARKPQLIVANKMDVAESAEKLERFRKQLGKPVLGISALRKSGLEDLVERIRKRL